MIINTIRNDLHTLIQSSIQLDVYNDYAPEEKSEKGVVITIQSIGNNNTFDGLSIYQTINFTLTIFARSKEQVCDLVDEVIEGIDNKSEGTIKHLTIDNINFQTFDPNSDALHVVELSCNANLWVQ